MTRPDCYPIENLWVLMVKHVHESSHVFSNINQLISKIHSVWNTVSLDEFQNLVRSFPSRLVKVIQSKGGKIDKYWFGTVYILLSSNIHGKFILLPLTHTKLEFFTYNLDNFNIIINGNVVVYFLFQEIQENVFWYKVTLLAIKQIQLVI